MNWRRKLWLVSVAAAVLAVGSVAGWVANDIHNRGDSAAGFTGVEHEPAATDWWDAWEQAQQDNAQPPCLDVPSTHPSMAPPSPDGEAYSTDADGRVTWVNPCVVTSGWTIQEIEWISPDDLVTCFYNGASEWLCSQT